MSMRQRRRRRMHHNNKTHTDGGKERKRERETLGHGEDNIVECSARQQGREGHRGGWGSTADEPKSSSSLRRRGEAPRAVLKASTQISSKV